MARLKTFDSKYAPGRWGEARESAAQAALRDTHHDEVLERLRQRTQKRSSGYRQEAIAFVEEWRTNHLEGYGKMSPAEIVLATIVAVSIRRGQRGEED